MTVTTIGLGRTCAALCQQNGWRCAVLIVDEGDDVVVGTNNHEPRSFDEVERMLVLALYMNTHLGLEAKDREAGK